MNSCIKKAISLACATMLLAAALSGCGGTSSAAPASSAASASSESESLSCGTRINMSTASSGSLFYTGGIAVTQLWTEKLGAIASASSSSGSAENATLLINGETNMGIIQSNIIMDAYNGKNAYEGNPRSPPPPITFWPARMRTSTALPIPRVSASAPSRRAAAT